MRWAVQPGSFLSAHEFPPLAGEDSRAELIYLLPENGKVEEDEEQLYGGY